MNQRQKHWRVYNVTTITRMKQMTLVSVSRERWAQEWGHSHLSCKPWLRTDNPLQHAVQHAATRYTRSIMATCDVRFLCVCVAVCWGVLKYIAVRCGVLQCVAVCCNVLQYTTQYWSASRAVCCQSVASITCCSVLQCVAVSCNDFYKWKVPCLHQLVWE